MYNNPWRYISRWTIVFGGCLALAACGKAPTSPTMSEPGNAPDAQTLLRVGTIPTLPLHGLLGSLTLPGYWLTPFGTIDRSWRTLTTAPVKLTARHGSLTTSDDGTVLQCYRNNASTMMVQRSGGMNSISYALTTTEPLIRYCGFAAGTSRPVLLLATDQAAPGTPQETTHTVTLRSYQRGDSGWLPYSEPITVAFQVSNLAMRIYTFAGHFSQQELHLCLPTGKHLQLRTGNSVTTATINNGEHLRCLSYADDWLVQQRTGLYLVHEDRTVTTLYESGKDQSIVVAQPVYEAGQPVGVIWLDARENVNYIASGETTVQRLITGAGVGLSAAELLDGRLNWFGGDNGLALNFYSVPLT